MRYGGVVLPWKSKTDITKNSFWDDPCRLIPYYRGKSLFVLTNPGFMFLWIQFKSRWYSIDILVYIDNFSNQPFGVTSIFWPYGKHFSGQTDKGNRLQWRRSWFWWILVSFSYGSTLYFSLKFSKTNQNLQPGGVTKNQHVCLYKLCCKFSPPQLCDQKMGLNHLTSHQNNVVTGAPSQW